MWMVSLQNVRSKETSVCWLVFSWDSKLPSNFIDFHNDNAVRHFRYTLWQYGHLNPHSSPIFIGVKTGVLSFLGISSCPTYICCLLNTQQEFGPMEWEDGKHIHWFITPLCLDKQVGWVKIEYLAGKSSNSQHPQSEIYPTQHLFDISRAPPQ